MCLATLPGQQPSSPGGAPVALSDQQHARAVIDKMITALGGPVYLNLQDSYSEGRYGRFHNERMVGEAKYYRYWKWPGNDRWEITEQRDIVQLYLGDKAYEVTYQGSRELNPEKEDNVRQALVRRHYALETVLRTWLNEPGTMLLDEGSTLAENHMAERITIINSRNESVTLLVNQDTNLPIKKIFVTRDPKTRDRDEEVEIFDNWRLVQGINTPFNVVVTRNGAFVRQLFIFNVTYNTHPPDDYFTPKLIKHQSK